MSDERDEATKDWTPPGETSEHTPSLDELDRVYAVRSDQLGELSKRTAAMPCRCTDDDSCLVHQLIDEIEEQNR